MKTNQIIILIVAGVLSFCLGKFIETKQTQKKLYQAFYCYGLSKDATAFSECMYKKYDDLAKEDITSTLKKL